MNVAYNRDCMEAMREFPDNAFDLAVVDPPYGDGLHAENGGGKGWFTKYNQAVNSQSVHVERERERAESVEQVWRPLRQVQIDHLHSSCRARERAREQAAGGTRDSIRQKKSYRGT